MKKFSAIIALIVLMFAVSATYSQNQVTVHVTGGYDLPMSQLKGDINGTSDTNTYLQKSGFNAGADVKYYLGKKRNVGITFSAGYHSFSSGDGTLIAGNTQTIKLTDIAVGLGIEYAFMPKGKANPFIGAEFTGNFFSGKATNTPATGTATEFTLNSASRFGVQFNGGVDIKASKNIGFVIGLRYNLANLIGKDSSSTAPTASTFDLDDKATVSHSARNIGYLSIYGGVSFYFGKPKSTIKK